MNTSVSGQITFRWQSTNVLTNTPVNFDVVLFSNGQIRFDYGAGNANVAPTVGISFGNGNAYQLPAAYDNQSNLGNANSILFSLAPGIVDMGAYEFQGSSLDMTPPTVASTFPPVVSSGGAVVTQVNELQVSFSEGLNPIDAAASALYQLVKAGSNGFGSANDVYYPLTASYNANGTIAAVPFTSGTNLVTLSIGGLAGGYLPAGTYELTVFSSGSDSIHDLSGNALAGNGTSESNYVRIFTVGATQFAVTTPSSTVAGSPVTFTVTALDANNNLAANYSGVVSITSSDGQAVLPGSVSLTNGVGTGTVTLKTAGAQTLTATDPVTNISGTSSAITVQPTAATRLALSGALTGITAGTAAAITVQALDPFGNVATSYAGTVHFSSSDKLAGLPADSTLTAGLGVFSTTLETAGNQTLTATDTVTSNLNSTFNLIFVVAAAPANFGFIGTPSTTAAGNAFRFTVAALDSFGNIANGYKGTVHFSSNDSKAVLPQDATLTAGVGTFSATLASAGTLTLTAADDAVSSLSGTSPAILVSPIAASQFAVFAPATATAGTAVSVTVSAEDRFGNFATGYQGTIHVTSTDPSAVLPINATLAGGLGTFNVTLKTAQAQTVSVADITSNAISGTSQPIIVSPLAATHFGVSALDRPHGGKPGGLHRNGPGSIQQHRDQLPWHRPLQQHRWASLIVDRQHTDQRRRRFWR